MKIGIVGSRRRNSIEDFHLVKAKFFELYKAGDMIVSGGCPQGADAMAEKIAKDNGCKKIYVISGVGVRDYYKKIGYKLEKEYMVKKVD